MSVTDSAVSAYVNTISRAPPVGTILATYDGSISYLRVQLDDGKAPFIYGRAYPSEALGDKLGWYLRSAEDERNTGYKCILLSAARRNIIRAFPDEFRYGLIPVKSLRVVRLSNSNKSLLCEVHRYGIENVKLSEVLPLDSVMTEAEGLEYLRSGKWVLMDECRDKDLGRILPFCVDPNGVKVNIVL